DRTITPVEMRLWQSGETDDGIWMLIKDISEMKAMQQLRDDVDRIMRHDLKNPLSGIIGLSDILKVANDGFSDDQKQWIEQINKSGLQALTMINHSMDLFKMEQGRYVFLPVPCNIVPVFKKIETDFFQLLRSKKLDVLLSIQNVPVSDQDVYSIMGEKTLIETLFANLIKNAIEASPDNQNISVNILTDQEEHKIIIHNQGMIPKDMQNRFFDKYATSGKKTGTGLGTYSAKLITKTHGGKINFISNEKDGTQIIVSLPKSSQDSIQQNSAVEENSKHTPQKEIPKLKKQLRMLVADDSSNNMLLIGHYLERFPCVIDFADNGKACVDYFKTGQYDLVMVDLQMPIMNGLDAIAHIRAYEKENSCIPTPIVAISADCDEKVKKQCTDMGSDEFLSKPFSESNIQDIVVNFCQNV
ncbi:Multi-sensor signal transduction histidine kinase, partial [Candidatus Magnetomorum sp. HK-1]